MSKVAEKISEEQLAELKNLQQEMAFLDCIINFFNPAFHSIQPILRPISRKRNFFSISRWKRDKWGGSSFPSLH